MQDTRARLLAALAGTVAGGLTLLAYGALIEPRLLDISALEITPIRAFWPPAIPPLTVAHLSDLHVGGPGPTAVLDEAIAAINRARPNMIALTGDIIGSAPEQLAAAAQEAIQLLARLDPGPRRIAVLGNHDHLVPGSARHLSELLADAGWTILNNSARTIKHGGHRIHVVGVDDRATGHDNFARATAHLSAADQPRLLLSHTPDLAAKLTPAAAAVVLSGHIHGGQINLPGVWALLRRKYPTPFRAGLYDVHGVQLYVSRGLGESRLRLRIAAPPELAFLTIKS